jgi:hypothetical protein
MGVFKESLYLLNVNYNILSGKYHSPMLVKCINWNLNKGLCIMSNKRDSIQITLKTILLLICTWNSCPVLGTNISHSLVVVGRKFSFPIDFSADTHAELISAPGAIPSYSHDLVEGLNTCHAIAKLLVQVQHCWHHKLINSLHPDPWVYSVGNIVFAQRATWSDSKRERLTS